MPIEIYMGVPMMKEAYRIEISHLDHGPERLAAMLRERSLPEIEGEDPAMTAARISGTNLHRPLEGKRTLVVRFPDGTPLGEILTSVTVPKRGIWANWSQEISDQVYHPPAWVTCDNKGVELVLAEHYGCPAGHPDEIDDWVGHPHHSGALTVSGEPEPPEAVA